MSNPGSFLLPLIHILRSDFDAEIPSKTEGAGTKEIQAYMEKKNLKENISVNPEKQNQDSHLSVLDKKHNLSLVANELGKKSHFSF